VEDKRRQLAEWGHAGDLRDKDVEALWDELRRALPEERRRRLHPDGYEGYVAEVRAKVFLVDDRNAALRRVVESPRAKRGRRLNGVEVTLNRLDTDARKRIHRAALNDDDRALLREEFERFAAKWRDWVARAAGEQSRRSL